MEHKIGGIDMKKIEERADRYIYNNFCRIAEDMPICDGMRTLYIESATEQKAIDIEKACEYFADWMRRHNDYAQFAVDGLRKAMEE